MFNKYYQDELAYLRELGREFAELNPESAGWLAEPGVDPDVERLMEGFCFLTARIRQKLDDELPEFTHGMLELFWPHYLRTIPSMTIMQFAPKAKATGKLQTIAAGAEVASSPIDGTSCQFRTVYPATVAPLTVDGLEVGPSSTPYLNLTFKVMRGATMGKLGLSSLRFHFSGTSAATRALYLTLARYVTGVRLKGAKGEEIRCPVAKLKPVGFAESEALLPVQPSSYPGFRLLQEYFTFPEKFMFLDLIGVPELAKLGSASSFEMTFELSTLPQDIPPLTAANVLLNCSPAVNLFKHDANPVRLDRKRVEYSVRPGGDPKHFEVYSIESVKGIRRATPDPRVYHPFYSFFRQDGKDVLLYKSRVTRSLSAQGTDLYVTFLEGGQPTLFGDETVSIELTCSNRYLPTNLGLGEITRATSTSPSKATFKNVIPPTAPVPPPLDGDLFWSLISHLSLNYLSLLQADALGELLRLYDFRARYDRQAGRTLSRKLEGILSVKGSPRVRLDRGATIRGMGVEVLLDEEKFGGEGEVFLFGSVLDEFLAHYVTLNGFSQLTVKGKKYGEAHEWSPKTGARAIL